eukprot:gene15224-21304_t
MAEDETISLRPITLRPGGSGGANPFSQFGKGSGFGIKSKQAAVVGVASGEAIAKNDAERIKYSKTFLLEFMEMYNKCPIELQHLNVEFVIQEQSEKDQQRAALLKVAAEELDDRDWRSKDAPAIVASTAAAPAPAAANSNGKAAAAPKDSAQPQAAAAPARAARAARASAPAAVTPAPTGQGEIVSAADMGRQAYRPGAQVSAAEKSIRQIKGILNKLTPEKFERLLQQLLEVITTASLLQQTITLVFENAVEQPTFCTMYAELCFELSKELPTFPSMDSESPKPMAFHQILLNTCQDEFEGTEQAREVLLTISEEDVRSKAERAVKKRTLGNMRLISELYKMDMVKDWIMGTCVESLLEKEKGKTLPTEDNIEAACEMIGTAGSKLAKSENANTKAKLEDFFRTLAKFETDKALPPRVRFLIKDLMDLRKSNWVARREVFTAKKLEDVRAQAEAELGMVSSNIAASLPTLPAQQRIGAVEDFALLPPLRSAAGDGDAEIWSYKPSTNSSQKHFTGSSALLGDYQPIARANASPIASTAAAPAASSSAPSAGAPGKPGSEEDLKRKTESLFSEFCSTLDKAEASTCVKELESPEFMSKLVEIGLDTMLNSMKQKEVDALEELLLHLYTNSLVKLEDILTALSVYTDMLEDLSLDVPKAPSILGHFIGSAIQQNILPASALPELLSGDFGAEPKRDLSEEAFKCMQAGMGDSKALEVLSTAGVKASAFLTADELDGDMASVEAWLKDLSLSDAVPL